MGRIERGNRGVADPGRGIAQRGIGPVEAAVVLNELGVDIVGDGFADEGARCAAQMDRRQDPEHLVVERFAHARERKSGERGVAFRVGNGDHDGSSSTISNAGMVSSARAISRLRSRSRVKLLIHDGGKRTHSSSLAV